MPGIIVGVDGSGHSQRALSRRPGDGIDTRPRSNSGGLTQEYKRAA
jgi:hypothetical protein